MLLPVLVVVVAAPSAWASARFISAESRLYAANDSLLGLPVPCSDAEKTCFRYNRALDAASGSCVRVGSRGPCLDGAFLLDRREFDASGRLVGSCADAGRCPDFRFRMAYDGRCASASDVFGRFCDPHRGLFAWPHVFGGYECICDGPGCPDDAYVEQPDEPGKCLFPNFRRDLSSNFFPRLPENVFPCSDAQNECFSRGMVFFDGACFSLLDLGPCPEASRLVLDRARAFDGTLAVSCAPLSRCPPGESFMTYEGRCRSETDIANVLCPDLATFTDPFGDTVCRFPQEQFHLKLVAAPGGGRCGVEYHVTLAPADAVPTPKCAAADPRDCLLFEDLEPDVFLP